MMEVPIWWFVVSLMLAIPTGLFLLLIPLVFIIIAISDKIEETELKRQRVRKRDNDE